MKHKYTLGLLILVSSLLVMLSPNISQASSVYESAYMLHSKMSKDDITKQQLIVTGTIINVDSFWDDQDRIYTLATLEIQEQLAGETLPNIVTLHYYGGTVGDVTMHIAPEPKLSIGDQITVPLREWGETSYRIDGGMDSIDFINQVRIPDYTFLYAKWAHDSVPISYYINQNGTSDTSGEFNAVQLAYNTWSNVSCSWIAYSYQGTTSNNPGPQDGKNVVGWLSTSASPCPDAAACAPYFAQNGVIVETDIIYNENRYWSIGGVNDIQGIGTHEAGHNVGLGHSNDTGAVMYPYYSNGVLLRTLGQDDINGVCALYPPDSVPPTVSISSGPTTWLNQNYASFYWTGLDDQTATNALQYSYRIINITNWSSWSGDTSHTFSSLPDGLHTFQVKARDEMDNVSSNQTRPFSVDATPPTVLTMALNNSSSTSYNSTVIVDSGVSDNLSGVDEMCVSYNQVAWDCAAYSSSFLYSLPAINQSDVTVYFYVIDQAGNESSIANETITLDFYPDLPSSLNYRLCSTVVDSAGGSSGSTSFHVDSAVGQPSEGVSNSDSFQLSSGFMARGADCGTSIIPTYGYEMVQDVIAASGEVKVSSSFTLVSTFGEASASPCTASTSYKLSSGFWGGCQQQMETPNSDVFLPIIMK